MFLCTIKSHFGLLWDFFILSCYKIRLNDLINCGAIVVDFCYSTMSFCFMKVFIFFWGGGHTFGPLVQKLRIWAEMKSNGRNTTRNKFYGPNCK